MEMRQGKMENLGSLFQKIMDDSRILIHEPMSMHTTFRIGGPADYFLLPQSPDEVQKIIEICSQNGTPWFVVGNGSNLLVSDQGCRGVIIQIFRNMSGISIENQCIRAQAGASLKALSKEAMEASLTGFEFAGGIPGTLGGAVAMNAGAYGGEMKDVLQEITVLTPSGRQMTLQADQLELGYRTSVVKTKEYVVLEAVMKLQPGQKEAICAVMGDLSQQRRSKQPLEYPSAGSTFKRPQGYFAGKLIMDAGLRGYRLGGAQVSEKHCGFVVNCGGASASDVIGVMRHVQEEVWRQFQVELEPEVKLLGDFS